ncbi:NUMOD3 domain-containing DNA-binding protein [uncultured Clostridium sp.]|uniref:NUMOD3 domain-containing DNA-binding protein n=1 Tax=uncultured Clostridium sp. TaxID=59620 RepID=UPI00262F94F8|nr:NUMOD3 domain-containing DNA-binding protein [uncultured Clostridium sp.]
MNYNNIKDYHDSKMRSKEIREKISRTMKTLRQEKGFSQETRNKISQKLKGNQHFKGKKRTKTAIQKTSKSLFKSVYCIDLEENVLKQFNSVIEAAK